jgi:hypothetical protein
MVEIYHISVSRSVSRQRRALSTPVPAERFDVLLRLSYARNTSERRDSEPATTRCQGDNQTTLARPEHDDMWRRKRS